MSDFTQIFLSPGRKSAHIHKLRQSCTSKISGKGQQKPRSHNEQAPPLPKSQDSCFRYMALPALQVGDSGNQSTMLFGPQSDMAYWDKVLKYILVLFKDWDKCSPGCLGQLLLTSGCCVPVHSLWANPRPSGKLFYYQEIILRSREQTLVYWVM